MRTDAAILVEPGRPLRFVELETPVLEIGQVLIEIAYSGACHTQILEARGYRGHDPWCPHCLGHEGSGVVLEVGENVKKVRPGDEVVLSWIKGEGADVAGAKYDWDGTVVNAGGVTTFSRHAVVSENRLVKVPGSLSRRHAILLGCAGPTGFGSVVNVCRPNSGQSIAVFGAGGVGLCAIAAAVYAKCSPVIAIDPVSWKRDLAIEMGATHAIDAAVPDVIESIRDIVPGGLDFAIEATGRPDVMAQALSSVRPRGGLAVVIGNARKGELIQFEPSELNLGKRLFGTWGGDARPDRDFPVFADILNSAPIADRLLSPTAYGLADINAALDDLEAGKVSRPLIDMSL